jgi:hypothetical protein
MTTDLNLYRVHVTQEWTAEADALVWAPDQATAKKWAKLEVELSTDDAEAIGPLATAKPEPIDEGVLRQIGDPDLWLIVDGDVVEPTEFRAQLTPDRLEALRLARIEAGNGQLALLEVAA